MLDPDSAVLKKRAYWHLIYDLRSVLQIKSVPRWLVYSGPKELLQKLVEVRCWR